MYFCGGIDSNNMFMISSSGYCLFFSFSVYDGAVFLGGIKKSFIAAGVDSTPRFLIKNFLELSALLSF